MNKTKIDWCDSTWNPISGCLHGCPYCNVEKMAKKYGKPLDDSYLNKIDIIYNNGIKLLKIDEKLDNPYIDYFTPTLHTYRLHEPERKTKSRSIFVGSVSDVFGEWIPNEWIEEIMKCCYKANHHKYLFLTKNPKRYSEIENILCKENCWYGTSINNTAMANKFLKDLNKLDPSFKTFLSIEPLLDDIDFENNALDNISWVIIGAETGENAHLPKKEWVEKIIKICREKNIPIFLKTNLNWDTKIKEYPWK